MNITGGKYNSRKLITPDEKITRPTLSKVRMGVFNTLYSILNNFENKSFLDLFGGSGIMGLEAASRGFNPVYVSEKNKSAIDVIKKNYTSIGLKPNLFAGDSIKFLKTTDKTFDVIYIDPPYNSGIYTQVFDGLLNYAFQDTIVVVEHSSPIQTTPFTIIKEKNYGGKIVSFYRLNPQE